MKKMKLFLLAALLIGVGSAFTTVKPTTFTDAFATLDGGVTWIPINQADEGVTYDCVEGLTYCKYASQNLNDPIGVDDSQQYQPK
jgi:hypothetical protein